MSNPLVGNNIISVEQFDPDELNFILDWTELMRELDEDRIPCNLLGGRQLTALFYQPSSRTFGSFTAAMQQLGGSVIPIQNVDYSSVAKGESLTDTVQTFASYSDVIALRHPDDDSSEIAAKATKKPVINAGSGKLRHPTQALLDLATIENYRKSAGKSREDLTVTMVGDLLNGRTIKSLLRVWPNYTENGGTIYLVSPNQLRMPINEIRQARRIGLAVEEFNFIEDVLPKTDVLYMTRVQKEHFDNMDEYEALKNFYTLTPEMMGLAKGPGEMIVMHPLPRVGEISTAIDSDPRAQYIKTQMPYGKWVRMALLAAVLGREEDQIRGYLENGNR
jgi:aspartate carbamoyltransferase catalytic subunit